MSRHKERLIAGKGSRAMNKKAGLYGLAVHAGIVLLFVRTRIFSGEQLGGDLLYVAMPLLLVSAFGVYTLVVPRYLARRAGMQKPLFIDALVGILLEYVIFTSAAVLFGVLDGLRSGPPMGGTMISGMLTSVFMNILWVYATFMIQILVIGNLCGLGGWWLLKKFPSVK
jgi:hypothetical protein